MCSFLDNRTVKTDIGKEHSKEIKLLSGVPQGSVVSPTLYTFYTNDVPSCEYGCFRNNVCRRNTRVITFPSKSKLMMKLKVEREIERINKFERKWKIQTSEEKFKIIPIAQHKTQKINVNGKEIQTCTFEMLLGLNLTKNSFCWPHY